MSEQDLISIGELAERTGISVDTIRIWERRYGRPVAERLPSGHRRYAGHHVRHLRRVAEALALGHRPSKILKLEESALEALLAPAQPQVSEAPHTERRLALAAEFARRELVEDLEGTLTAVGVREFLTEHLLPLLTAAGRAWADGRLEIRHEHFLSELLEDHLRTLRGRLEANPEGPVVLLATLAGERHGVGLQVAALFATLAGARPRILGTDLPVGEIVAAAEEVEALVVGLSVSLSSGGVDTDRLIGDLRRRLPGRVRLMVGGRGGRGPRRGPKGVDYFQVFEDFERAITQSIAATAVSHDARS